jgi:CzcA family heavy metal efflux pump
MMGFSVTSPRRSTTELWDLAYYELVPKLYRLPGIAEIKIVGGRPSEYHVVVDPEKLNSYQLPLTQVVNAIRDSNLIAPAGMVEDHYHLYLSAVTGLVHDPGQIEEMVVTTLAGTPLRIKDLARVELGEKPVYNIVTADGRPAVLINIMQQPDGNAVAIADSVKAEMESIRKSLPPDIQLAVFYDQSLLVRESISGVAEAMLIGLFLSVLVLLGFLKNWRTTFIAALVIPVAMLVAVVFMKLFQMSFNLMTLGGLAAAVGVVIDDAIVMVENITVHISMGQSPRDASRNAIQELTPALIGSTLTPIVVFAPLIFLGGITAVFFRALALTLSTALLASLFLAIFVTPVLASHLLKPSPVAGPGHPGAGVHPGEGRILQFLNRRYEEALHWSLNHTLVVGLCSLLILGGSVGLFLTLGSSFLPEIDEGAFVLDYVMPPGTSLTETDRVLRHVERILQETPEVESYSRRTGARLALAIAEPNTGDFLVKLKSERSRRLAQVTDELRRKINQTEPALEVEFPHILEDLIGDLTWSPEPIEVKIYQDDQALADDVAMRVEEWLSSVSGVVDVVNQNVVIGPSVNFRVDLEKAGRAGFTTRDVADIESAIVDGTVASKMIQGTRERAIRVRYPKEFKVSFEALQNSLLTSPTGTTLPLSSIAHQVTEPDQREIHRENLRNVALVTAQLSGRDLGSAMSEIQRRLRSEIEMPAGTEVGYGGLYQLQRESFSGLLRVLLLSILLIFVILVFEFRSFSHPIAILVATLLCGFGALLALHLTGSTLNISSIMGAIMVIGIVHKNGILMLDAEGHFTEAGHLQKEAIFLAGRRRLRPILMTALATIFGMLPLAFRVGSGAELLSPLAISVVGGVAVSMLLSLVVTPVLFYRLRKWGL